MGCMLACNTQSCLIKHSAFLINNYLIHSAVVSSYFRRRLPSAGLEKAFSTCHHQSSNNIPSSRTGPSRHLAWKRYINRRILRWDWRQGHQSKNHQNTSQTMEVQSTNYGCHQSTLHCAKHDISTKADRRQRHHNTARGDTSNRGSTTHGIRSNIIKETEGCHHRGDTSTSNNSTSIICTINDSSKSTRWKSNTKKDTGRQHHRRKAQQNNNNHNNNHNHNNNNNRTTEQQNNRTTEQQNNRTTE